MRKPRLRTRRLRLSPLPVDRLRALIGREPDPEMQEAYGEMLYGCISHPAWCEWYTAWGITLPAGEWIGDLCFKGPPLDGEVEIGYGLLPDAWGHGYATEAVGAALRWAFAQPGVWYVTAETVAENAASRRVLAKLGFRQYGEGAEGPRFEKEKPAPIRFGWGVVTSICAGLGFGWMFQSPLMGVALGVLSGLTLSFTLTLRSRVRLARLRAARQAARRSVISE